MPPFIKVGLIAYVVAFIITGYLFRNYLSRDKNPEAAREGSFFYRRFYVSGINVVAGLIAMAIAYIFYRG